MPKTLVPFLSTLLSIALGAFLIVMTTAFLSVPHAIGGHPGEAATLAASSAEFHPT